MAREKELNQKEFTRLLKDKETSAEVILTRQKEKQAAMDEYDKDVRRFRAGQVSRRELRAAMPKLRNEMRRLDQAIRTEIAKARNISSRAQKMVERQSPKRFRVSMAGVKGTSVSRRATAAKVTGRRR